MTNLFRQDRPAPERVRGKRRAYYLRLTEGMSELEIRGQERLYRQLSKADLFDAFVDLYRQTHGEEPNLKVMWNDLLGRIDILKRQGLR